jgi:hypothetical protein
VHVYLQKEVDGMTGYEPLLVTRDWDQPTDRDWAEVLGDLPLFSGLGKRRLRKLAHEAQFAEFASGETVISTGAAADSFYVMRMPQRTFTQLVEENGDIALTLLAGLGGCVRRLERKPAPGPS